MAGHNVEMTDEEAAKWFRIISTDTNESQTITVQGVNITLVKGKLEYEAANATDKNKAWARIKKYDKEIRSYLMTFKQADTLADYLDAGAFDGGAEERILKKTELNALIESMRVSESSITGLNLHDKVLTDRVVYLDCLSGLKSYQCFDDDANRKNKDLTKIIHDKAGMNIGTKKTLETLNKQGAGVYMTVNETDGKGRTAKNITKIRACFADFDGAPLSPVWAYEPSLVVETSPGKYHAYWRVGDGFPLEGFTQMQESIALTFGSDQKVKDLPRVMRLPGFMHNKNTPFLSRIIHYSGEVYSFGRLTGMFPPAPAEQWSAEKYQKARESDSGGEFKGQYGSTAGNRNCDMAKIIGGMLKDGRDWGYIENECFKHNSYSHPPLPDAEVRAVLKSCRRYT